MNSGVEESDNLAIDSEGSWKPDCRAETGSDAFGDAGLSVARLPEQKHATSGVDRRAQVIEHRGVDDQVGERSLEIGVGDFLSGDALSRHRVQIIGESNGRGTEVC